MPILTSPSQFYSINSITDKFYVLFVYTSTEVCFNLFAPQILKYIFHHNFAIRINFFLYLKTFCRANLLLKKLNNAPKQEHVYNKGFAQLFITLYYFCENGPFLNLFRYLYRLLVEEHSLRSVTIDLELPMP